MIVETEAVVLHAFNYGDTSEIVTVYTRKYGKIKVVAKGTRNPKSNKFGSSLELMTHSSIVLYKKEHKDLHLLSKSEIVSSFNRMQDDSEKIFSGLALIELVNMVMHDEEENETIFSLLVESLQTIDRSSKNGVNVLLGFFVRLFRQFGFGLSIDSCSECERKSSDNEFQSVQLRLSDGKFICSSCSKNQTSSGVKITGGILKTLLFLQENPIGKSIQLSVPIAMRDELFATLQSYLRYHIESVRTLKSLSMLYSMK
ncbi:MAG TPA: DNA repair protein RecO [Bacteroidetes bacterium]|nr:DNA repair protein RecO [Bacteroidota bacterium]